MTRNIMSLLGTAWLGSLCLVMSCSPVRSEVTVPPQVDKTVWQATRPTLEALPETVPTYESKPDTTVLSEKFLGPEDRGLQLSEEDIALYSSYVGLYEDPRYYNRDYIITHLPWVRFTSFGFGMAYHLESDIDQESVDYDPSRARFVHDKAKMSEAFGGGDTRNLWGKQTFGFRNASTIIPEIIHQKAADYARYSETFARSTQQIDESYETARFFLKSLLNQNPSSAVQYLQRAQSKDDEKVLGDSFSASELVDTLQSNSAICKDILRLVSLRKDTGIQLYVNAFYSEDIVRVARVAGDPVLLEMDLGINDGGLLSMLLVANRDKYEIREVRFSLNDEI